MARRTIDVMLVVGFGNGDEGVYKISKIPIPKYIYGKGMDKDEALESHAEWVAEWVKQAIKRKELDDEQMGIMESW